MPEPPFCADRPSVRQLIVPVVEQVRLARDTYRLRLEAPELARMVVPGQFFMIRSPDLQNPLLARPFALYDTWLDCSGQPAGIDIVYLVVGKMTRLMSSWKSGQQVEIWGPLGNGFPRPTVSRLLLVAGGIGNTPFPAVAREAVGGRVYGGRPSGGETERGSDGEGETWERAGLSAPGLGTQASPLATHHSPLSPPQVTFCYGARSAEYFAGVEQFEALGVDVRLATDDGSRGHRGFVTDLVEEWLRGVGSAAVVRSGDDGERGGVTENQTDSETGERAGSSSSSLKLQASSLEPQASNLTPHASIFCCGPEPMMYAVARLAAKHLVPCWLSLETPMACGFGACFSCVTRVKQPDGAWDYRRTCVEGPIFPAASLEL